MSKLTWLNNALKCLSMRKMREHWTRSSTSNHLLRKFKIWSSLMRMYTPQSNSAWTVQVLYLLMSRSLSFLGVKTRKWLLNYALASPKRSSQKSTYATSISLQISETTSFSLPSTVMTKPAWLKLSSLGSLKKRKTASNLDLMRTISNYSLLYLHLHLRLRQVNPLMKLARFWLTSLVKCLMKSISQLRLWLTLKHALLKRKKLWKLKLWRSWPPVRSICFQLCNF